MSKLDDALHDALSEEDAEFLARFEEEPGSLQQIVGVFRGPFAWMYLLFLIVAVTLGPVGVYCAWRFAGATDLRPLLYWGSGAGLCLAVLTTVRLIFFMQVQTNRVVRELKRLELQVARLAARESA